MLCSALCLPSSGARACAHVLCVSTVIDNRYQAQGEGAAEGLKKERVLKNRRGFSKTLFRPKVLTKAAPPVAVFFCARSAPRKMEITEMAMMTSHSTELLGSSDSETLNPQP